MAQIEQGGGDKKGKKAPRKKCKSMSTLLRWLT